MLSKKITTYSAVETQQLGEEIAQQQADFVGVTPLIFALQGELGAGKTQFVKGLARGFGITGLITSPSYTLVNEYAIEKAEKSIPFVHIDAWRLSSPSDLETIGWNRFLEQQSVIALEWAHLQNLEELAKNSRILPLSFTYESETDTRTITVGEPL